MSQGLSLRITQEIKLLSIGNKKVTYTGIVEEIGKQYIAVMFPSLSDAEYIAITADMLEGTQYTFKVANSNGVYSFSCGFRSSELLPKKKVYFEHPIVDERIQRRNFIRIPFEEQIEYAVIEGDIEKAIVKGKNGKPTIKGTSFKKATAINISAGGMSLRIQEEVKEGSFIGLILELPDVYLLTLVAKVMHCDEAKDSEKGFIVGIKFEEQIKNSADSLKFSRALADIQRDWLKRGRR